MTEISNLDLTKIDKIENTDINSENAMSAEINMNQTEIDSNSIEYTPRTKTKMSSIFDAINIFAVMDDVMTSKDEQTIELNTNIIQFTAIQLDQKDKINGKLICHIIKQLLDGHTQQGSDDFDQIQVFVLNQNQFSLENQKLYILRQLQPNSKVKVRLIKDEDKIIQAQFNIDLIEKNLRQEIERNNSKFGVPLKRSSHVAMEVNYDALYTDRSDDGAMESSYIRKSPSRNDVIPVNKIKHKILKFLSRVPKFKSDFHMQSICNYIQTCIELKEVIVQKQKHSIVNLKLSTFDLKNELAKMNNDIQEMKYNNNHHENNEQTNNNQNINNNAYYEDNNYQTYNQQNQMNNSFEQNEPKEIEENLIDENANNGNKNENGKSKTRKSKKIEKFRSDSKVDIQDIDQQKENLINITNQIEETEERFKSLLKIHQEKDIIIKDKDEYIKLLEQNLQLNEITDV